MDLARVADVKLPDRRFCAKLYLKAETQQVDRILEEFARRYWDCNPTTVLGNASASFAQILGDICSF